jgi:hypothetical protein
MAESQWQGDIMANKASVQERITLWNDFRKRWPYEKLQEMTLDEYVSAGNKDTFKYWVVNKTSQIATISGGSEFFWGVYSRGITAKEPPKPQVWHSYSDKYGWDKDLGDTPEAAFNKIKKLILAIAKAAEGEDLDGVAEIATKFRLPIYAWKIAFMYQKSLDMPIISDFFEIGRLSQFSNLDPKTASIAEMHKKIIEQMGNRPLFELTDELALKYEEYLKASGDQKKKKVVSPIYTPPVTKEKTVVNTEQAKVTCNPRIYDYYEEKGLFFSKEILTRYFLSLKTKSFVILTGISGTGKTKIAQIFADYICQNETQEEREKRIAFVPVKPDWMDNKGLLGYYNLLDEKYHVTLVLRLLLEAEQHPESPTSLSLTK